MKVLIISQYFYPDNFRINDIASGLVDRGHEALAVVGLPDYETGRIARGYTWLRRRRERYKGVQVHRVFTVARRTGAFWRLLNYMSYAISSTWHCLFLNRSRADCIYIFEISPVIQAIPAIFFKKKTGKKLVLHCYDLWPESLKAWNIKESSKVYQITQKLSAWIYQSCDIVAITSTPFKNYLMEVCGVDDSKITYLPQHAEDLYADIAGNYIDNQCIDFMFAGNLGAVQDVSVIIKAVALMQTSAAYRVHILGDGSEMGALKKMVKDLNLEDLVIFHGRRPLEDTKHFYNMADCFLLTLRGGDFIGKTLPAKIQGYLCAGKPVLGAIDGAGQEIIEQANCGVAVPAGDAKALAGRMQHVIDCFDEYKKMGINGRTYYETHFTKDIFMTQLETLLKTGD